MVCFCAFGMEAHLLMKVYQRKERYRKIGGEATHREILFEGGLLLIEFSHLNRWCTLSASGTKRTR